MGGDRTDTEAKGFGTAVREAVREASPLSRGPEIRQLFGPAPIKASDGGLVFTRSTPPSGCRWCSGSGAWHPRAVADAAHAARGIRV